MNQKERTRARLWEEADGHCIYCGHPVSLEEMEVDHIEARSMGGGDEYRNKVCCCHDCNSSKGNTPLEEYLIDRFSERKLRKYRNRLDTLVRQGRMTEAKADALFPVMGLDDDWDGDWEEEDRKDKIQLTVWQWIPLWQTFCCIRG